MFKKAIGNINVSDVLLGSELFGTAIDEKTSFEIINRYLELGGNCVDTARLYGGGKSEETIGKWIKAAKSSGKEIIVSTKGGHPRLETMNVSRISQNEIESDINGSLKALGVEAIDIYWLHRDDLSKSPEEILEFMNTFISSGKIKNFGVSNWHINRILKANAYAAENGLEPIAASQIKWSLAVPNSGVDDQTLVEMDENEYQLYKKAGIPVIAYSSQGKGIFSILDSGGEKALSENIRKFYLNSLTLRRFKAAKSLSEKYGMPISSIVLSYIYSNPDIKSHVLIGPVNVKQLEDSLTNSDFTLSREEITLLSQ